jgi:hypothetical protein
VRAFGEEAFELNFQFRRGIWPADAERVEPARAGSLCERSFYRGGIAQKSRSV